jgi:hypothetical protein
MYAWVWRHLPGPAPVRAFIAAVMLTGVVAALFLYAFPWLQTQLGYDDTVVTVDAREGEQQP